MDKFIEALKSVGLPQEQIDDVVKAVQSMVATEVAKVEQTKEAEFNDKLEKAYGQIETEKKEIEESREVGYQQAYEIINDLMNRNEAQKEEFETHMDEQYEEAYKMIEGERSKNQAIESELYEEADKKLQQMKNWMIDRVDTFLQLQEKELYENAKREVLNDPRMVEHKVALDKITSILAGYLSDDDYSAVTSSKLEEASQQIEDLKSQVRLLESKNTRLQLTNGKLTEETKAAKNILTENKQIERQERATKAKQVSGRGKVRVNKEELIAEFNNPMTAKTNDDGKSNEDVLSENVGVEDNRNALLVLSGLQ